MSRFLILSEGGDGCGLALRLQDEGHEVRVWIREPDGSNRCQGLINLSDDPSAEFGEIVVADSTGFGKIMDRMRENDIPTFGGSALHDRLEDDRKFAKQVMKECDIETPESEYFDQEGDEIWAAAEQYIKDSDSERLVFKPAGGVSGVIPSYVSHNDEELIRMLQFFKSKIGPEKVEFEIQEFKEGIAVSTEGWFDGIEFVGPFNHTIERKHLMCGDIGPSGGCSGNLVWIVDEEGDPLVWLLQGLTEFLSKHRYIGPIDLNAVVGEEGIYGLEFTPRLGYDAFPTYLTGLFNGDFGAFIAGIVKGSWNGEPDLRRNAYAAGVRISIPPWPSEKFLAEAGIPVLGWNAGDLKMVYPYDLRLRGEELSTSGGWGIIGVVNGVGGTIDDAFTQAYKLCKKAVIPDKQYRTDLAEACAKDYRAVGRLLEILA